MDALRTALRTSAQRFDDRTTQRSFTAFDFDQSCERYFIPDIYKYHRTFAETAYCFLRGSSVPRGERAKRHTAAGTILDTARGGGLPKARAAAAP